jgi:16S rRNA (cytidine1402-2'-O)-methyltransferase
MILYIVPVPVGNLKDITLRAIEILKTVDFIIAEDTRHSLKLLNHLGIKKKLVSYYKHREQEKAEKILTFLEGKSAALISDSGTPLISDPGFILIQKAILKGVEIIPIPGPTAFVPALAGSGLSTDRFIFLGFPPRKKNEISRFLKKISEEEYTLIFYESPRRVETFLGICHQVLGDRKFALVKELSKINEQIIRGNLDDLDTCFESVKFLGEMVVIIEGRQDDLVNTKKLELQSIQDIFDYFKENHHISKNDLKKILMKKSS